MAQFTPLIIEATNETTYEVFEIEVVRHYDNGSISGLGKIVFGSIPAAQAWLKRENDTLRFIGSAGYTLSFQAINRIEMQTTKQSPIADILPNYPKGGNF